MDLLRSSRQRFGLITGALLIVIVITLLAIWPLVNPPPPTPLIIETTDSGAHILFSADSDSVPFPGRCVTVRWSVEGVQEIEFNGSGVVGQDERSVCIINRDNYPRLDVELRDGTEYDYHLEVEVLSQRPIYLALFGALFILIVALAEQSYDLWLARKPRPNWLRRISPLAIAIVLTPLVTMLFLLHFYLGANLLDYVPASQETFNDEMAHWHQIATFTEVGFNGGYYTVHEYVAPFSPSHFGAWGPTFPIIFGTLGKIFGWQLYSALVFNVVLVMAALAWMLYALALDRKQLILTALLLLTFWPMLLFLPSNMQEGLHFTLAIIFTLIFYRLITRIEKPTLSIWVGFLLIVLASLIRFSWELLFIPYFLLVFSPPRNAKTYPFSIVLALGTAAVFIAAATWAYVALAIPFPRKMMEVTTLIDLGAFSALQTIINNIVGNISQLFDSTSAQISLRSQVVFLSVSALALGVVSLLKAHQLKKQYTLKPLILELGFHCINLGGVLIANIVFKETSEWRDYRVIAPHVLLSLLLLIAMRRYNFVVPVILCNFLLTPSAANDFQRMRAPNYFYDMRPIEDFRTAVQPYLVYDSSSENAWCNTVTLPEISSLYLAVPAGMGVSYTLGRAEDPQFPLNSRYLLIPETDELADWLEQGQLNVELLTETRFGTLYLNLDAEC